jgi:diguanylate cyclase (GGDEF)-like protein
MFRFKAQQPHRTHLLAWLALILALGFLTTAVINYMMARDKIRESILAQELPLTGDNIYSELQKDMLRPVFISSLMARDTFLRDWVIAGEQDSEALVRYLNEIRTQYGTITSFFVSEHTRTYYYYGGHLKQVREEEPRDRWYFRVRGMKQPYETNVDPDLANRDTMTVFINHRVMDYHNNFIGVAGVGLTLEKVSRLIDSYQTRFQRRIFFVSSSGEVMLRGSTGVERSHLALNDMPGLRAIAPQILASGEEQVQLQYERNGSVVHVNSRFIPELGWYLVVEQDETAALSPLRQMAMLHGLISLLVTLAVLGMTWYAIRYYQRRLEQLASTDKLTGLYNRQALDALLEQAVKDVKRNGGALSIVVLDIDRFKEINDKHGHAAGDIVIGAIADLLKSRLRQNDIVARWGGEEFLLLLRNCPADEALRIAQDVRRSLAETDIALPNTAVRVTLSGGVAEYMPNETASALFIRADEALYRAKLGGRDRVEMSGMLALMDTAASVP